VGFAMLHGGPNTTTSDIRGMRGEARATTSRRSEVGIGAVVADVERLCMFMRPLRSVAMPGGVWNPLQASRRGRARRSASLSRPLYAVRSFMRSRTTPLRHGARESSA